MMLLLLMLMLLLMLSLALLFRVHHAVVANRHADRVVDGHVVVDHVVDGKVIVDHVVDGEVHNVVHVLADCCQSVLVHSTLPEL